MDARISRAAALFGLLLAASAAQAQQPQPAPPSDGTSAACPQRGQNPGDVFAGALRAYHAALLARRLGHQEVRLEDVSARVGGGERLGSARRVDEAIARLGELVENPEFEVVAYSEEGRAAVFRLGDALAIARI